MAKLKPRKLMGRPAVPAANAAFDRMFADIPRRVPIKQLMEPGTALSSEQYREFCDGRFSPSGLFTASPDRPIFVGD